MPLSDEEKHARKINRTIQWMKGQTYDGRFNKTNAGVAVLFQRLVRLTYANENGHSACVTCSKAKDYRDLQGGHFIGRKNKNVVLDWRNVWPQCVHCNDKTFGLAGNLSNYREFLLHEIGAVQLHALESKANGPRHEWTIQELAEIKVEFQRQIKEQERRIQRCEPAPKRLRTLAEWKAIDNEVTF